MDDIKRQRSGRVWVNGYLAGILDEFTDGQRFEYRFQYDAAYLATGSPIGHHYPLQSAAFVTDILPPFFENLTSEGWVRAHQTAKARTDKRDSFGLLLANGKDLIGAVSLTSVET